MDQAVENKTSPTSELRLLAKGTLDKVTIKDRYGEEHELAPLDLADMIEYEEKLGHSLLSGDLTSVRTRHVVFLLYLSLRKAGCTKEEILARKFKYTNEQEVYRMFDLRVLGSSAAIFVDILRISGLDLRPAENAQDPPKASQ